MTGEWVPAETMLALRTRVGEVVCDREADSWTGDGVRVGGSGIVDSRKGEDGRGDATRPALAGVVAREGGSGASETVMTTLRSSALMLWSSKSNP